MSSASALNFDSSKILLLSKALKTLGNGENDDNQHFLLFQHCFLSCQRTKVHLYQFQFCVHEDLPI